MNPVEKFGLAATPNGSTANNTVVYDYVYNGSSLSYLTVTTNQYGAGSADHETLYFGNGTVTYNGTVYYFVEYSKTEHGYTARNTSGTNGMSFFMNPSDFISDSRYNRFYPVGIFIIK